MSIMDMFRSAIGGGQNTNQPAAVQNQLTPPQPGNLPANPPANGGTQVSPGTAPNGVVPTQPTDTNTVKSPLDEFSTLWQNDPNASGAAKDQNLFNVDPAKLMEAASRVDFSKAIKPEQLQAIQAGGEGAVQAFAQAMNSVSQTVFAQNALASTKIVEQAVKKMQEQFRQELPSHIKDQQVFDNLKNENPIFSHPATAPMLEALKSQFTQKYPNATANEITGMAKKYLESFASSFAPAPKQDASAKKGAEDMDWSTFLS